MKQVDASQTLVNRLITDDCNMFGGGVMLVGQSLSNVLRNSSEIMDCARVIFHICGGY